ncbi:MAG: hypothetical protein IPO83_09075 [Chitinophagaceae bacterium]|nr:hypothetical protein [Chitinophagaceae bacterium]
MGKVFVKGNYQEVIVGVRMTKGAEQIAGNDCQGSTDAQGNIVASFR